MKKYGSHTQSEIAGYYQVSLNTFKKRLKESDPQLAEEIRGKHLLLPGQFKRIRENPEFGDPFEE